MKTESAQRTLHSVGYKRTILALGACWGAVPALRFGLDSFSTLSSIQGTIAIGSLMMLSLVVIYELDSRILDRYGSGVPLAWSYALVVPLSAVGGQFSALCWYEPRSVY